MANTILGSGSTGYQYGVETDETGINIESISCRYFPEFDDHLPGKDGVTQMRCRPSKFSREISIKGEVKGATGLMALTLIAGATVANDLSTFGDGTGLLILDEVTENQDRKGWRGADFKISSSPGLTSAT